MATNLIFQAHDFLAQWVAARIKGFGSAERFGACTAIGIQKDEKLVAAVVYSNYRGHDMEMSIAADGKWASKGVLDAIFRYPFIQCNCKRVTAVVARGNKKSRTMCETAGFRLEGVLRKSLFDGTEDAFVYGMLRDECRWIPELTVVRQGAQHGKSRRR